MSGEVGFNYYNANVPPQYVQNGYARIPQYSGYNYSNPSFGQDESDRFEKSGGSGFVTGTALAAVGTVGGAATGYYLNGNPVKKTENGKLALHESFAKTIDKAAEEDFVIKAVNAEKMKVLSPLGITDIKEYQAVEKLANATKLEDLAEDVRKNLPKGIDTPDAAKNLVAKAKPELDKLNIPEIVSTAKNNFKQLMSLEGIQNSLKNYKSLEEGIVKLGKDATPEQIKEFVNANKELFRVKNDAELEQYLKKLEGMTQEDLLKEIQTKKGSLQRILNTSSENILKYVDKESGKLLQDAPKELKNLFKDFKWAKAKQFGLWGAGIGLGLAAIKSMFSGNKS